MHIDRLGAKASPNGVGRLFELLTLVGINLGISAVAKKAQLDAIGASAIASKALIEMPSNRTPCAKPSPCKRPVAISAISCALVTGCGAVLARVTIEKSA